MKTWQYRYLVGVALRCDSWGVSKRVKAGKVRKTAGGVVVFCVDFSVSVLLSSGSSSVERAHNLLNRGILRRREAEELV